MVDDQKERAHPLKKCVNCNNSSEPLGGVELRGKWHCAKCWVKFINGKIK